MTQVRNRRSSEQPALIRLGLLLPAEGLCGERPIEVGAGISRNHAGAGHLRRGTEHKTVQRRGFPSLSNYEQSVFRPGGSDAGLLRSMGRVTNRCPRLEPIQGRWYRSASAATGLAPAWRGRHGVVYAGYDKELDRKVAVKVLRAAACRARSGEPASCAKPRAWRASLHPNVVSV